MATGTLTITRGDDAILDVAATDANDAPVDLTGATAWWTAKARQSDLDADALITKTTANGGVVITNAAGGLAEIRLAPGDTANLADHIAAWWDFQVKDATNKVYTLARGRLIIQADITRAT